jgi:hypothetical protein
LIGQSNNDASVGFCQFPFSSASQSGAFASFYREKRQTASSAKESKALDAVSCEVRDIAPNVFFRAI